MMKKIIIISFVFVLLLSVKVNAQVVGGFCEVIESGISTVEDIIIKDAKSDFSRKINANTKIYIRK